MSRSGEIRKLGKLIRPHIGIITNIGEAHIENFGNREAIAKEKMKDLNAFDIKEATKIICGSARSMGIEVKD